MSYPNQGPPSRHPHSPSSYQNIMYGSIAFVRSDVFLVRMFGERDAAFFIESLLKMNAREVCLIGNVPGWSNALMVQRPSVGDTRCDALANNDHPLWLLDFIPPGLPLGPLYHVVPQKIWTPPNQSDWRRYVEQASLRMPVFFVQNNGAIGLPLPRAAVGDTASLRQRRPSWGWPFSPGSPCRKFLFSPYPSLPPLPLVFFFFYSDLVSDIKHRRIAVARIRIVGAPDTDQ